MVFDGRGVSGARLWLTWAGLLPTFFFCFCFCCIRNGFGQGAAFPPLSPSAFKFVAVLLTSRRGTAFVTYRGSFRAAEEGWVGG